MKVLAVRLVALVTVVSLSGPAMAREPQRNGIYLDELYRAGDDPALARTTESYTIPDFPIIWQMPELPTGCEITALTMAMQYYGCNVSKTTMARQYLPTVSPSFYYGSDGKLYGPDMDKYFVDDPFSTEGYICGTPAICTAANNYFKDFNANLQARDITGSTSEDLYALIDRGTPVVVWVTIDMVNRSSDFSWYSTSGKYMSLSYDDHCAVLIGHSSTTVTLADPISGQVTYSRSRFESVFRSRNKRCVILAQTEPNQSGYIDVPDDVWYADAVSYCRNQGLMNGINNSRFVPSGTMTRAMLATVLYRLAGQPKTNSGNSFADVNSGEWYTEGILWSNEKDIAAGYGNGMFGINDSVTREQVITMLWRYEGRPEAEAGEDFSDELDISEYAATAVDWAKANGLIYGRDNNCFYPKSSMTRAELAAVLYNYMHINGEEPPAPDATPEPDVTSGPDAAPESEATPGT